MKFDNIDFAEDVCQMLLENSKKARNNESKFLRQFMMRLREDIGLSDQEDPSELKSELNCQKSDEITEGN